MLPSAFHQGQEDYKKGVSVLDCPYMLGTKEADQWLCGWNEAMEDYYETWDESSGDETLSHR